MKLKNCKKGQLVRIYNPNNMFLLTHDKMGDSLYKYDDSWLRGTLNKEGNFIEAYSIPNDKYNYIVVKCVGLYTIMHNDENILENNLLLYKLIVIEPNMYVATFIRDDYRMESLKSNMIIYSNSDLEVKMHDSSEKERLEFITLMFPILSAKYPNLNDNEILKKAKKLSEELYNI